MYNCDEVLNCKLWICIMKRELENTRCDLEGCLCSENIECNGCGSNSCPNNDSFEKKMFDCKRIDTLL